MKRSLFWRSIAGMLCGGMLLSLSSCEQKPEVQQVIRPVRYEKARKGASERLRSFSGVSYSSSESKISFRVPGKITRIEVKVGDQVNPGDLMMELDDQDYQLQVQKAEASLFASEAESRHASANYSRIRALYEDQNASRDELDASRAAAESAEAAVDASKKQLELAQLQLSYTKLLADSHGSIAEVPVEENENVSSGQMVLLQTSTAIPEVKVTMPEIYIGNVKEGDRVKVNFDALADHDFDAWVREVGVKTSEIQTAYPVTVRLIDPKVEVRSGLSAEVLFSFVQEQEDIILVSSVAVASNGGASYVFTLDMQDDGLAIVRKRAVVVGDLTNHGLQILQGLKEGELVVIAGVSFLEDGNTVKLLGQ